MRAVCAGHAVINVLWGGKGGWGRLRRADQVVGSAVWHGPSARRLGAYAMNAWDNQRRSMQSMQDSISIRADSVSATQI